MVIENKTGRHRQRDAADRQDLRRIEGHRKR